MAWKFSSTREISLIHSHLNSYVDGATRKSPFNKKDIKVMFVQEGSDN